MTCDGVTTKGTKCSRSGPYNGFCYQHVSQDRSGRAAQLYANKDGGRPAPTYSYEDAYVAPPRTPERPAIPAGTSTCYGKIANGSQCSRNGHYNGYCYQHVTQDNSGRAARLYAEKDGGRAAAAPAPARAAAAPAPARAAAAAPSGVCYGKIANGSRCSRNGHYNGYCHQHVTQDNSGRAARLYAEKDGGRAAAAPAPARAGAAAPSGVCYGKIANGSQCSRNGHYNGYCHQHMTQDNSGRAARLYAEKDGGRAAAAPAPARAAARAAAAAPSGVCYGKIANGSRCSRNGHYNGYCHQHVTQDNSGRAARLYADLKGAGKPAMVGARAYEE